MRGEWLKVEVTAPLKTQDVVGCGWVKEEEGGQGTVYFTLDGQKTETTFTEVPPEMIPFLHIQKKVCVLFRVLLYCHCFSGVAQVCRDAAGIMLLSLHPSSPCGKCSLFVLLPLH